MHIVAAGGRGNFSAVGTPWSYIQARAKWAENLRPNKVANPDLRPRRSENVRCGIPRDTAMHTNNKHPPPPSKPSFGGAIFGPRRWPSSLANNFWKIVSFSVPRSRRVLRDGPCHCSTAKCGRFRMRNHEYRYHEFSAHPTREIIYQRGVNFE